MLVPQRATPRWKEWIPLISQQQRLRNLFQICAFNVPWAPGSSFYYTLHLTSMSPPFYTSEHANHQHPRWTEMEITALESTLNTSATGVVIRLWRHQEDHHPDQIILVWGLHFSGLIYLGPYLSNNAKHFNENTLVLHLQGGFFTDRLSLKDPPHDVLVRHLSVMLSSHEVRPSYSVSLLLRLRNIQQAIKKQTQQSMILREKILAGGVSSSEISSSRESNPTLRKLLNKSKPKPQQKQETFAVRCQLEVLRFRVALLRQEKLRKMAQVEYLQKQKDLAAVENSERSCLLTARYQTLHKETEQLKENRRQFASTREVFLLKNSQLSFRRRQLMSQLSLIYPVVQTDGKYTICGVHLPNSEELTSSDDVSVSVALGFVAHLVQMVSIFLQVPLRYPIIHFGSRSKIIDYVSDRIPDKEREFPLFSRGKDKLLFHYGVYLLNKDIAQLRWLVGFPTNDLRTTLHNVYHLLHLNQFPTLDSHHRSMSGSSLDIIGSSSTNISPVSSMLSAQSPLFGGTISASQVHLRSQALKLVSSSAPLFHGYKRKNIYSVSSPVHSVTADGIASSGNLSCSLDTGLNEYKEMKKAEASSKIISSGLSSASPSCLELAHVGSEPNLVTPNHHTNKPATCSKEHSSQENCGTESLQRWKEADGAEESVDTVKLSSSEGLANDSDQQNKSEFTIVTERIAELVGSCANLDDQCLSSALCSSDALPLQLSVDDTCSSVSAAKLPSKEHSDASLEAITDDKWSDEAFGSSPSKFNNLKQTSIGLPVGDNDVDIGTDALADITTGKLSYISKKSEVRDKTSGICFEYAANIPPICHPLVERRVDIEENGMECVGVEERVLVDNLFANVTSRTEALASSTTSFNLMSSRHGSS